MPEQNDQPEEVVADAAATKPANTPSSNSDKLKEKAESLGIAYLTSVPKNAVPEDVQMISEEVSHRYGIVTFFRDKDAGVLHTAMIDPQDLHSLNILRFLAQKEKLSVEVYLASSDVIEDLQRLYGSAAKAVESAVQSLEDEATESDEKTKKKGDTNLLSKENIQDAPVAKLVQVIIRHALDGGASDIHIEPIDNTYRVRFRVDGILHASLTFPIEVGRAVISRIKILATLKIDEKRKPQDGRFRVTEKGNAVDFRVSTLPVVEGEKIVMRVLEKDKQSFDLSKLGLMGSQYDAFMDHIRDPFGLILMTGPTGSGKSTTLYAFLSILNQEDGNIITLEDPVEYFIPGINQSQVKPEIGYNFASGLRSILRQDPDVIMVGEIRDGETAELAIHAALTGHLVFSTVHTNSAVGALPRLHDMGVEPFLIGSSVRVIAAQRLVRRICENCKQEQKIPPNILSKVNELLEKIPAEEVTRYGIDLSHGLTFYKGKGCDECGGLGLKGRVAIYEVIPIDDKLEEVIVTENGDVLALERAVRENGVLTIKQDGILKVLLGHTTLSELERVTEGSLMVGGDTDEVNDNDFQTQ
jgi:type IV pilus assembly protein PilB